MNEQHKFDVDYTINKIQEQNKSCAYDTMAMYASTHKKKGTSLKELAKSCNTEEFTLESVLNNN